MPRDPFIREKFTKESTASRDHAKNYFKRFPKKHQAFDRVKESFS
jgi:hypothetical protein